MNDGYLTVLYKDTSGRCKMKYCIFEGVYQDRKMLNEGCLLEGMYQDIGKMLIHGMFT